MTPAQELRAAVTELHRRAESIHPGMAELAGWLEATAVEMDKVEGGVVEGSASKKVHPVSQFVGLLEPRADWTAALAVARVINGGAS